VLEDSVGLKLLAPEDGWQARPDMDPAGTRGFRASVVARARGWYQGKHFHLLTPNIFTP